MRLSRGIASLASLKPGAALSIGNFDGVHLGHAALLTHCRALRSAGASAVAVATFEPHPLTVLKPERTPPRLAPISIKHAWLAEAGVDELIELPPDREVLNLSAEQFWHLLRDQTRPSHLVEGENFTFGKDRTGTTAALRHWCAQSPITFHVVDPVAVPLLDLQIVTVSSSLIRFLIAHGRVREAGICLGRPYTLVGPVVKGFQRGRTIGVPTANLQITEQLIPAEGVYAGRCVVNGRVHAAAVSIGTMPTFGDNPPQVEAHLIDFSGDLYEQTLQLELVDWLRDQQKYPDLAALKTQLSRDIAASIDRLGSASIRPIASLVVG